MVKYETSTTFIGIKILLSDLILQINETNFNLIKKILMDTIMMFIRKLFGVIIYQIIIWN